jgi:hypothetical protein
MKTRETIEKNLFKLSEDEQQQLDHAMLELSTVKDTKKITEDTVKKFNNVLLTVTAMRDNFMWRLLAAAKQNHML